MASSSTDAQAAQAAAATPKRFSDFDVSTLKFGSLRPGFNGGKNAWLRSPPMLTLPAMRAPFGLKTQYAEHDVSLSLDDPAVRERMEAIDALALAFTQEHREALFDERNRTNVMLEVNHCLCAKPANDPKYAPTLKLKLKREADGAYQAPVFGPDNRPAVLADVLNPRATVQALVMPRGFWAASNRYGVM